MYGEINKDTGIPLGVVYKIQNEGQNPAEKENSVWQTDYSPCHTNIV